MVDDRQQKNVLSLAATVGSGVVMLNPSPPSIAGAFLFSSKKLYYNRSTIFTNRRQGQKGSILPLLTAVLGASAILLVLPANNATATMEPVSVFLDRSGTVI